MDAPLLSQIATCLSSLISEHHGISVEPILTLEGGTIRWSLDGETLASVELPDPVEDPDEDDADASDPGALAWELCEAAGDLREILTSRALKELRREHLGAARALLSARLDAAGIGETERDALRLSFVALAPWARHGTLPEEVERGLPDLALRLTYTPEDPDEAPWESTSEPLNVTTPLRPDELQEAVEALCADFLESLHRSAP